MFQQNIQSLKLNLDILQYNNKLYFYKSCATHVLQTNETRLYYECDNPLKAR